MQFVKISSACLLRLDSIEMVQIIDTDKVKVWVQSGLNFEFTGSAAKVILEQFKQFFGERKDDETKL